MSMIACSKCGAQIDSTTAFCNHCGAATAAQPAAPTLAVDADNPTKPCPFCGEKIMAVAIKCRFCGSDLRQNTGTMSVPMAGGGITLNAPAQMGQVPSVVIQNVQAAPAYPVPRGGYKNPGLAAVLSFFIPGVGQMYNGEIGKGILFLITAWLIIPWIWSIFDAYSVANRINRVGY